MRTNHKTTTLLALVSTSTFAFGQNGPSDPIGGIGVGAVKKGGQLAQRDGGNGGNSYSTINTSRSNIRGGILPMTGKNGDIDLLSLVAAMPSFIGQDPQKLYAAISTSRSNIKAGIASKSGDGGGGTKRAEAVGSLRWYLEIDAIEEMEIAHEGLERQQSACQLNINVDKDGKIAGAMLLIGGRTWGGASYAPVLEALTGISQEEVPKYSALVGKDGNATYGAWDKEKVGWELGNRDGDLQPLPAVSIGKVSDIPIMVVGIGMPVEAGGKKDEKAYSRFTLANKVGGTNALSAGKPQRGPATFGVAASAVVVGQFDVRSAWDTVAEHMVSNGACRYGIKDKGVQITRPRLTATGEGRG